ncbi:hypothetical protein ACFL2Z_01715 [Candidatus Eisenbacteria bacterium]|uniref:Uncharacterized protein n=1 Tax=Eiseniibacteriota bacterium TaxID=2212470 RepID=A0ABV6YNW3_UNCEI
MESRRLNRLAWAFALVLILPAALQAGTGGVSVTCAREEIFRAARTPMYTAHLAERLIVAASDTVYIGGDLAERGEGYWVDYSQGIVYIRGGISPGDSMLVRYSAFPVKLKPSYSLRSIDRERRSQVCAIEPAVVVSEERNDYDLTASGFKTISMETGSLKDVRINQSLNLNLGGKIGESVEIRGVLSDGDASFGGMTTTTKLKDMDRVFMEVRSNSGFARVGDIEIAEAPGQLLKLKRNMTGFMARASHGSKGLMLSGAASRSQYESVEIDGKEGISGPYVIIGRDGQRAGVVKGSERVWVDGQPMTRGVNADYTIDYNLSEIHFSPRHMIRNADRIVVDFEAHNYDDGRQFYFGKTDLAIGSRSALAVSFVNEGYSPVAGSPLSEGPNGTAILGSGGGEWVDGGEYVGVGKGAYLKIDLDTLAYYEFVGEGSGDYGVKFSQMGEGEGTYTQAYSEEHAQYVYIYTGQGDYVAMIRVSPKLTSRVVHLNANTRPVDWLDITSEVAQSRGHCRNTEGQWDLEQDQAYTVELKAASPLPTVGDRDLGTFDISAMRRSVGENYIGFDRMRRPDFLEVWAQEPENGFEESDQVGLGYSIGEALSTSIELGTLETPEGRSRRYSAVFDLGSEKMGLNAAAEQSNMAGDQAARGSERNSVGIRMPVKFVQLGIGRTYEARLRLRDSTSVKRTEYHSGLSMSGQYGKVDLAVSSGVEDRDLGGGWDDYAKILEGALRFESNMGKSFSVRGAFSRRNMDYAQVTGLSDRRTTGAELHMNLRDLMALSRVSVDYRLANTLSPVYGYKLVKSDFGGDYDSLGLYTPGTGDYVLSRFENGTEPVTSVRANVMVELGRKGRVLPGRSLSARTGIDIEGETSSAMIDKVALLSPSHVIDGPDVRLGRVNLVQEILFHASRSLSVSLTARGSRTLDSRAAERSERRTNGEVSAKVMSSALRGTSLGLEGRVASTRSQIQMSSVATDPVRNLWMARLNAERSIRSNLRSKIKLEILSQNETEPVSATIETRVSPGFTFFAGPLRWDGSLGLRKILKSTSTVTLSVPPRDSMDWDSRVNMRQGKYTSLSLQYSGRKLEGLPPVHNLRASLTATF